MRVTKPRRLRWAVYAACMGEKGSAYRVLKERDHLKDLGVGGKEY
jgi:hypothetical protein